MMFEPEHVELEPAHAAGPRSIGPRRPGRRAPRFGPRAPPMLLRRLQCAIISPTIRFASREDG